MQSSFSVISSDEAETTDIFVLVHIPVNAKYLMVYMNFETGILMFGVITLNTGNHHIVFVAELKALNVVSIPCLYFYMGYRFLNHIVSILPGQIHNGIGFTRSN